VDFANYTVDFVTVTGFRGFREFCFLGRPNKTTGTMVQTLFTTLGQETRLPYLQHSRVHTGLGNNVNDVAIIVNIY